MHIAYNIAVIAFFCGQMCELETLYKKRAFSVIEHFTIEPDKKKQRTLRIVKTKH